MGLLLHIPMLWCWDDDDDDDDDDDGNDDDYDDDVDEYYKNHIYYFDAPLCEMKNLTEFACRA